MKTYTVKEIDWRPTEFPRQMIAETIFGRIYLYDGNNGWWACCQSITFPPSTLEEAKAAAEAYYLSRLIPALEEVS